MDENLRILVVEDDSIVGSDLTETLKRLGYEVAEVARSGEEALSLAAEHGPDLALMDIELSGDLDGIEIAKRLKAETGTAVIYMTGFTDEATYERARETQPAGYLRKPYSEWELRAVLESAGGTLRFAKFQTEQLAATLRTVSEAVVISDVSGKVTFVNEVAEELTGWTEAEARGRLLREVVAVHDKGSGPENGSEEAGLDGSDAEYDGRRVTLTSRDGTQILIEERTTAVRSDGGELLGLVSLFQAASDAAEAADDWTDDHPPYRTLRELLGFSARAAAPAAGDTPARAAAGAAAAGDSNAQVEALTKLVASVSRTGEGAVGTVPGITEITDPLFTVDASWRITYVNPEAAAYFAAGSEPIIGRDFWKGFSTAMRERYEPEFIAPLDQGRPNVFQFHHPARNQWFEVSAYPSGGGLLVLFRDITGRKNAEGERVRMQRLEGLGLLARGFAHDFNNLLTVLLGNLSLAKERLPAHGEFQSEVASAEGAAFDARNLVQQLLTFAKGGAAIREEVQAAEIVRRVLDQHRRRHPAIRYQFQTNDAGLRVSLDSEQFVRLLENLIANAEQAMPRGGNLIGRCGRVSRQDVPAADRIPEDSPEEFFGVEIIDTGLGMSKETLEKAFEPYFSTRMGANATGIGLTVCESIAKAHDGFILLQSREGKGTIASFYMPLGVAGAGAGMVDGEDFFFGGAGLAEAEGTEGATGTDRQHPHSRPRTGRILVLEDEPMIRRLIATCLKREGFEVVETADGRDTIRIYREAMESGRPFDLLLSDLTIPEGMGGVETMKHLRKLDPGIVAIVSSGYSDDPAMADPAYYGFSAVLPKPYPPQELRELVVSMVGRAPKADSASHPGKR